MRRLLVPLLAAVMLGAFAATASADGPQTVQPTAKQTASILKAWAQGGKVGPTRCYRIAIAKPERFKALWAGVTSNGRASGCGAYAFDGGAILYGSGSSFYRFAEGSDLGNRQCTAMALVMGNAWNNLVDRGVAALGCQNID